MNTNKLKSESVIQVSLFGAIALVDLVKSTLGPKGMDKLLQSGKKDGETIITNDGATVLKSVYVDNPVAKILVDVSNVQDDDIGDGTTSVVVLAGELLHEAKKLLQEKHHLTTIVTGFREACVVARKQLESIILIRENDPLTFRNDLVNIAETTLSSKIVALDASHFAILAVDAVLRLRGSKDIDNIQIIKKPGGTLRDSFIDEGFILDKKIGIGQPNYVKNAKILVVNTPLDSDKIKIHGAKVKSHSLSTVVDVEAAEKLKMKVFFELMSWSLSEIESIDCFQEKV
jgi:T-complex protein 1 subunit beta